MDDKDIQETMKGMVFLFHGLPPFPGQSWAQGPGREGWEGYGGYPVHGTQEGGVWPPLVSTGYRYLCKHNSGRNKDIIFPILESQSSNAKLSEKLGLWVFSLGHGLSPFPVSCMSAPNPPGLLPGSSAWP